nr:hypothetical protein [Tanacetum cinerariifolium]
MDLFAYIRHANPTKVRIGEKQIEEGQVPLLEFTRGRVVPHVVVNEQGNQNNDLEDAGNQNDDVEDVGNNVTKEGVVDGQEILVDAGIVRIEDEVLATVVNKPKGTRKKSKTTSGASGYALPPKRLRGDYGTSGDVGASTAEKSLAVGAIAAATLPFVTSFMTSTPEHESDDHTDSIIGLNLRTQHPTKSVGPNTKGRSVQPAFENIKDGEFGQLDPQLLLESSWLEKTTTGCIEVLLRVGMPAGTALFSLFLRWNNFGLSKPS